MKKIEVGTDQINMTLSGAIAWYDARDVFIKTITPSQGVKYHYEYDVLKVEAKYIEGVELTLTVTLDDGDFVVSFVKENPDPPEPEDQIYFGSGSSLPITLSALKRYDSCDANNLKVTFHANGKIIWIATPEVQIGPSSYREKYLFSNYMKDGFALSLPANWQITMNYGEERYAFYGFSSIANLENTYTITWRKNLV